jgi:hypothetical protein
MKFHLTFAFKQSTFRREPSVPQVPQFNHLNFHQNLQSSRKEEFDQRHEKFTSVPQAKCASSVNNLTVDYIL